MCKENFKKAFWKGSGDLVITVAGVFIALWAQNGCEHSSDRDKEEQYVYSLIQDLLKDSTSLESTITKIHRTIDGLDSVLIQMQEPMSDPNAIKLNYILTMKYDWFPDRVNFSDGAITQLKYGGGLRLISEKNLVKDIVNYDAKKNFCAEQSLYLLEAFRETWTSQKKLYNYKYRVDFQKKLSKNSSTDLKDYSNAYLLTKMDNNVTMLSTDYNTMVACYNDFANYKAALRFYVEELERQKYLTNKLILSIQAVYKFEEVFRMPPWHDSAYYKPVWVAKPQEAMPY
jgi:hypothetical protein